MAAVQKRKRPKPLWKRASENKNFQTALTIILPVLLAILIFYQWESGQLNILFHTDTHTLPKPTRIAMIYRDNSHAVCTNIASTSGVALLGIIIGSLIGYGFAVLAAFFPNMGAGGLSVIGAFASIPIVALAPVMNNWTKDVSTEASVRSFVAKVLVVTLIAAADMGLNAFRGLTELPSYAMDLMKSFAASRFKTFVKLQLPNSVPYIFTALKVSVPASIMTAIVSEYFAEYVVGVGRAIRENIVLAQYSTAWVYIVAACGIGLVFYGVLMVLQQILLKRYHTN